MTNPVYNKIIQNKHRTIYNKFYSTKKLLPNRQHIMHFDIFPSILTMLGFKFPNQQLGLGVSAFGKLAEPNITISNEKELDNKLMARSDIYKLFWQQKK